MTAGARGVATASAPAPPRSRRPRASRARRRSSPYPLAPESPTRPARDVSGRTLRFAVALLDLDHLGDRASTGCGPFEMDRRRRSSATPGAGSRPAATSGRPASAASRPDAARRPPSWRDTSRANHRARCSSPRPPPALRCRGTRRRQAIGAQPQRGPHQRRQVDRGDSVGARRASLEPHRVTSREHQLGRVLAHDESIGRIGALQQCRRRTSSCPTTSHRTRARCSARRRSRRASARVDGSAAKALECERARSVLPDRHRRALDRDRIDHGAQPGAAGEADVDDRMGTIDAAAGRRQHAFEHDVDRARRETDRRTASSPCRSTHTSRPALTITSSTSGSRRCSSSTSSPSRRATARAIERVAYGRCRRSGATRSTWRRRRRGHRRARWRLVRTTSATIVAMSSPSIGRSGVMPRAGLRGGSPVGSRASSSPASTARAIAGSSNTVATTGTPRLASMSRARSARPGSSTSTTPVGRVRLPHGGAKREVARTGHEQRVVGGANDRRRWRRRSIRRRPRCCGAHRAATSRARPIALGCDRTSCRPRGSTRRARRRAPRAP